MDESDAKYILKITGFVDYLIDTDLPLVAYEYVRSSLRSDPDVKTLKPLVDFTVVRISDADYKALQARIVYDRKHKSDHIPKDFLYLDYEVHERELEKEQQQALSQDKGLAK